jgi:hypothetical protein
MTDRNPAIHLTLTGISIPHIYVEIGMVVWGTDEGRLKWRTSAN